MKNKITETDLVLFIDKSTEIPLLKFGKVTFVYSDAIDVEVSRHNDYHDVPFTDVIKVDENVDKFAYSKCRQIMREYGKYAATVFADEFERIKLYHLEDLRNQQYYIENYERA